VSYRECNDELTWRQRLLVGGRNIEKLQNARMVEANPGTIDQHCSI